MDLKAELLKEHSKENTQRIVDFIGNDGHKFDQLMTLFFCDTYRVTQRAAWPLGICAEKSPEMLEPYLHKMIDQLSGNIHVAVKRNTVRALQHVEIPDDLTGLAADNCFKLLEDNNEPIAVKVFSMTVLANICEKEPALANELKIIIEGQLPYGSAGFKSRGKKILKKLEKLTNKKMPDYL